MKNKIFWSLFFLTVLARFSFAQVTVVEDSLYAPSIKGYSKFYAILPDSYTVTQERYTTIYLLHGFGGDYTNWVKLTDLVRDLRLYHYIVICPDAKNSWYTNSVTIKNADYEDLIIKDIIPFVDKKYRTKPTKFSRAVAGLSMGGYGAAKFGIKYPTMFFFAGCLSPAIQFPAGLEDSAIVARRSKESNESVREMFGASRNERWNENDVFALLEKSSARSLPYFYLSVGSNDGIPEIIDLTHSFAGALRKKKVPFEMHEVPGEHYWKLWDKEIAIVLQRIYEMSN
ncbi:MAG: alpha/beta hydrolase-fold protein [Bacteroidota bacterium]|jgi:S-formylglutathione hydrolase FrmB